MAILNEYYAEYTPYSSYDLATMSAAIKAKMKILKMTQMELSVVTGVSQPQLSRILRKDFKKIPKATFASITESVASFPAVTEVSTNLAVETVLSDGTPISRTFP